MINFIWGKNINQEVGGGGRNMNFKINIHPYVFYIWITSYIYNIILTLFLLFLELYNYGEEKDETYLGNSIFIVI